MNEKIAAYIAQLNQQFQTGNAREHAYRPALKTLIEDLLPGYTCINEPRHIEGNAPDFMLMHGEVSVAFAEAKDLGDTDMEGTGKNKEQFDRYKQALNSLFFTDYLSFYFYAEGEKLTTITLARIEGNTIVPTDVDPQSFIDAIRVWADAKPQLITTAKRLAERMAFKARLLADMVEKTLEQDTEKTGSLWNKLEAFKEVLIKDLDEKRFADLYAQTIAYGLFTARLHDKTPHSFSRTEAAELIPKTNPFLRQIFQQIAGFDIDDSIKWIVDDLVAIFAATDIGKLRKSMSREQQHRDPMIHFYEDFLYAYDPAAKKQSGVYYTPQPVVEFIVRTVDDILKTEFNLPAGLADISKTEVTVREIEEGNDTPTERSEMRHRVQVLDPATGTGTFLAEVVNCIKEKQQKGTWSAYVDQHLIPRIYGFELMMAPYTIAHLKLDMLIHMWGDEVLNARHNDRLQIYLTNSLDQRDLVNRRLLAEMIAKEANEANNIKHNAPVMVMLGNPPYSVSSSNKSKWITDLLDDYKKNLNERNIQPLSDDYIKFIRLGQYYIERTGEGILAYISNNSFLDGLIHRQMRRELMRCFDDIYILDLHGNNRKKETAPDGSKDENVFSIMQGVSINIFVKKPHSEDEPATIHHYDLYGSRKSKYAFLLDNSLSSVSWQILQPQEPNLFFVPKDFGSQEEYERGFKVDELMNQHVSGIKTQKDEASIFMTKSEMDVMKNDFTSLSIEDLRQKYNFKDGRDWLVKFAKTDLITNPIIADMILYRPFDNRSMLYTGKTKGIQGYPRYELMRHLLNKNYGLLVTKQNRQISTGYCLVTNNIPDLHVLDSASDSMHVFPLYLYPSESELGFNTERKPNFDETIWRAIENWVKFGQAFKPLTANEQSGELGFDAEPEEPHFLSPKDIFDYIYGVLHSPAYRTKYKEFLKVDFPRIPYPKDQTEFEHFRSFGNRLRELHLMHNVPESPVSFPESGSLLVEKVEFSSSAAPGVSAADTSSVSPDSHSGRVYINDTQFFASVPHEAWEFYIGGYQPAQKWLKDRKGRTLTFDDITHYQKIISVLIETKRLMDEIDQ